MNAKRELDALVAEYIFGWTVIRVGPSQFGIREREGADYNQRDSIYDQYSQDDGRDFEPPIYMIPRYSIDMNSAWMVIEKVKDWTLEDKTAFGIALCDELALEAGTYDYTSVAFVRDLCLLTPFAICVAAIKAKRVKVPL